MLPTRIRHALRGKSAGQSLAEFAIVLPILLALLGATLDLARAYEIRVKLESATRDAAEWAAMNSTTETEALTQARTVVCLQFSQPASCTNPTVVLLSYSRSSTTAGASSQNPLVSVSVRSSTSFGTLYPYGAFFGAANGAGAFQTTLQAQASFAVLQGR